MRIVEIRERAIPLQANIKNSVVNFAGHTVSLLALITDVMQDGKPVAGLAFDSIGRFGQSGLLRERFIPRLMQAQPQLLLTDDGKLFDPQRVLSVIMQNEKPGGHGDRAHAAAAIELAVWDLNAKLQHMPAWQHIANHFGVIPRPTMPVYAAGGYYYPEDNQGRLQGELQHYRDLGYGRFKMKIGGASLVEDMARIEAALKVVGNPADLAVDANGRFDLQTALAYGHAMKDFGLRWYEEAGDPLDFALMAALAEQYPHRLATGENLFSVSDVRNLVHFGQMRPNFDLFQMDPGLSYGLGEFVKMIGVIEAQGYSRRDVHPHGGHMMALHIVVGLGLGGSEAYPGVFSPFGGYTAGCRIADGGVTPGRAPGFGLEEKTDLYPHIQTLLCM
ncbi:enolase C-terminal domain-like protein [Verminephrobacter eiseniae]|uniref:Putative mandelate racemase n=1 Tax=Verminephrobacter eiseniae (strain EF01-2) TaxID=391735 RepID=A1WHA9_VEREI|nr:enolase C-terminal domain-like protein [Verminephrobacter eiseniae]ABM57016.1 putative mandelate racemase [Verminephrobacter eiseniae EF01-2]MCW5287354.1 mandelate racemase [Verminephrobacter eiseniae]MCW5305654.1 mandelate racemase [Verminephrobacter eiseniae]MCW8178455.1 mandelate racemase [Verminephrobacter eiseniae]MCW8188541.1 mandelate racemase [Verminephrobacter eiseniae]